MYALFIILNDVNKIEEIHRILYEIGCGATTFDSMGMGKVLLENKIDVSIFAGIRKIVEGNKPYNKTVVSVIREENKLRKAIKMIKEELKLDEKKMGIGFMFVVPVLECYGYKLEE